MNFLFKCNNSLLIKCVLNEKSVEFNYALTSNESNKNFSYLCNLNLIKKHDLIISTADKNLFTFFLLKSSQCDSNCSIDCINLSSNLYNLLFQGEVGPILLIGSSSGHVYCQNLLNSKRQNLNDSILLDTSSSPIIYINSFRYNYNEKKLFDALFKSSSSNQSKLNNLPNQDNEENCLFFITKSSRIYLFGFTSDYIYKCSILPHYISKCIKYKNGINNKSYLIYSTQNDHNLYSIDLDFILRDKLIKANLIRRNFPLKKFHYQNQELLAISLNGKQDIIKIDEIKANSNHLSNEQSNDFHFLVKSQLNKICEITNQIVKEQTKLDKYNLALKQFNLLQHLNFEPNNRFEIEKKFDNLANLEIKLTNKNLILEDQNINVNQSSYFIYAQVKLVKKSSVNDFWSSKSEHLTALKPNMKQIINLDISSEIKNNFMPDRIQLYLVYDVDNFIFDSVEKKDEKLNEFCVCFYDYDIRLQDFFEQDVSIQNSSLTQPKYTSSIVFDLLSSKLNNRTQWNEISFDSLKLIELNRKNIISNGVHYSNLNSNIMQNMSLNMSSLSSDSIKLSIYSTLPNNSASSMFAQKISNLIYVKNKFILPNFISENQMIKWLIGKMSRDDTYSIVRALMDSIEKIKEKKLSVAQNSDNGNHKMITDYSMNDIIDDSIKMDDYGIDVTNQKEINSNNNTALINLEDFYSIDTLLNLFEIYLNIRSLQNTNINF